MVYTSDTGKRAYPTVTVQRLSEQLAAMSKELAKRVKAARRAAAARWPNGVAK